jgi:RNA ligase (TIGR02306 family)
MEIKRKLASIQLISDLQPIPGADAIEKARVKGWWVVVKKGEFKVGDKCVYFEIDSLLPIRPEFEFLLKGSKPKTMMVDGKEVEGIRLRTIKLRGQISQGLALPITLLSSVFSIEVGEDLTEILGVLKYEPPIAPDLAGKVKGNFPSFIPKTDEERIQNMSEVLTNFYVTEKLDGTSVTYYKKDGVFGVCSRNLELAEGDTTQWKVARELGLPEKLPEGMALQGELVGEGIQKNPLKIKGHKVYFYNAYSIRSGAYLNFQALKGICESLGLETVPVLDENFVLPASIDAMLEYANGKSVLNSESDREGVVVRPKVEMQYNGQRLSFKAISNAYLLKNE